jgi:hypothetical protein
MFDHGRASCELEGIKNSSIHALIDWNLCNLCSGSDCTSDSVDYVSVMCIAHWDFRFRLSLDELITDSSRSVSGRIGSSFLRLCPKFWSCPQCQLWIHWIKFRLVKKTSTKMKV